MTLILNLGEPDHTRMKSLLDHIISLVKENLLIFTTDIINKNMKKINVLLTALLPTIFLLLIGCSGKRNSFRKVEKQFGVKLEQTSWINTLNEEKWDYNGDGHYLATFQTSEEKSIEYLLEQ